MIKIKIPKKSFLKKQIKKVKILNLKQIKYSKENKQKKIEIINKKLSKLFSVNFILNKHKLKSNTIFNLSVKSFEKLTNYDKEIMKIRYKRIYLTNNPSKLRMELWNKYIINNNISNNYINIEESK